MKAALLFLAILIVTSATVPRAVAQSESRAATAGDWVWSLRKAGAESRQCLPAREDSSQDLIEIAEAVETLTRSALLGGYFRGLLAESSVQLCWDPVSIGRGYFEPATNVIALAPGLSRPQKTLILAHELRHIDQYRRGFEGSLDYDMGEYVRFTYAVEADAQAFAAYYAWTERTNEPSLWKAAARLMHYDDIALAMEKSAKRDATAERTMMAGFSAWYRSPWRLRQYRITAAGTYLDWIDETKAIRRYTTLPRDYFDRLCVMPDGSNYGCHQTTEIGFPSQFSDK